MRPAVFVVEDNAELRENLLGALQELAGVRIAGEAIAEDEAWDWLQAHPGEWDVLLVDLFLRAGSGLGLLHRMGSRGPGQKTIVFSNYADATIRKRCAQLGVDAVFDKSTEVDALMEYLARLPDITGAGH